MARTTTRNRGRAAKKAATSVPSPAPAALDEARAQAERIVADAEQLATARIEEAVTEAEATVTALLDEARQAADALQASAEQAAAQQRGDAEAAAGALLEEARLEAEQLREGASDAAAATRRLAAHEAAELLEKAESDARELRERAAAEGVRLRGEARAAAEECLAQARGRAEVLRTEGQQALARVREDAERVRTEAVAEADRVREAGVADRARAEREALAVRADAERVRQHAEDTATALRTQASDAAERIRAAVALEVEQQRKDAAAEAERVRLNAEAESARLRESARAAAVDAETRAEGVVAEATTQVEEMTAKAAALLKEAEETKADADAALARALSRTANSLAKRKLREDAADLRREAKRKAKAEAAALREGRPTWVDKTRDAFGLVAVRLLTMIPILAPMAVAWTGQSGFAIRVLAWGFAASLVYAAAYELSTAFCAYLYDQARQDGDKGWGYRIATWLFGAGAAVQQWWHYSVDWSPTARAVTFSAMSMVGVILWEMLASLRHRRKRRKAGNLPPALPSLGMDRWVRYPVRSWTARSLMIDAPSRFPTAEVAWTVAGQVCADRKARRTGRRVGRPHADRYMVTVHRTEPVRRTGPGHGPSGIPAVHVFVDRPEGGPDRVQLDRVDRGPDRTSVDRTDRAERGPDRPKALDRGPDRSGPARTALPPSGPDRTAPKAARTAGPDLTKKASTSADRGPARTGPAGADKPNTAPAAQPDRTGQRSDGRTAPGPVDRTAAALELNAEEQRAIDILLAQNKPISRRSIGEVVRAAGGSIATDRASEIARHYPSNLRSA
ncbi:hypothetical protein [Streptomyces goshikiensis]|uniref:hypothetical protein n=1 Tax=Streptomyces goshikiensis TaxID=1942 RepID=UPI00364FE553